MIKDNRGLVIALMFQKIDLPHSIGEVEAMVAVRTSKFSLEVGIDTTILEGDYEIIINSLKDENASLASFGHLILDAKLFVDIFRKISISQVHRQGNFVAHKLAKHVIYVTCLSMWIEDSPPRLTTEIQRQFGFCVLIKFTVFFFKKNGIIMSNLMVSPFKVYLP